MTRQKKFDAVRTMREIRAALSREFQGMTFEEQQRYIVERVRRPVAAGSADEYAPQHANAGDDPAP